MLRSACLFSVLLPFYHAATSPPPPSAPPAPPPRCTANPDSPPLPPIFLPPFPLRPVARLLGYAGILPRPPLSRAAHKIPATVRRVSLPETPLVAAIATMAPPPPSLADALGGEGGEAAGVVRQPAAASR